MTNEELAAEIKQGNKSLIPQLWEQIDKYVSMKAGQTARRLSEYAPADYDDLYQSGYLAMMEAIASFDPTKEITFIYWYTFYMQTAFAKVGEYSTDKKKRSPLRFAKSLEAPLEGVEDLTLSDMIKDPRDDYEGAEREMWLSQLRREMNKAIDTLPAEMQDVLRQRYWKDNTQTEIAADLGITPAQVRQLESKGLRKLRHPQVATPLRVFLDERTNFYSAVGVESFKRSGTSAVEREVISREALTKQFEKRSD